MTSLARDLQAYYDAEAADRAVRELGPMRAARRDEFASALRAEGRRSVLEVGGGPGVDAQALMAGGFDVVMVDLSFGPAQLARAAGVSVAQASMLALPFPAGCVDAAWTMSTFVHLPDAMVDEAVAELMRPVVPGGLVGIGTWGGVDDESPGALDTIGPPRLFCRRTHERWRTTLEGHGRLERFDVHRFDGAEEGWDYQFAIVRTPD